MKFCLFIFEKTFSNHIQLSGFVYNNLFIPHQFKHTIWTSVSFDPSLFALSPHFSLNLKSTAFSLGLKGVAETQEMFPCLRGMSNLKIHIPLLPLKKEGKKNWSLLHKQRTKWERKVLCFARQRQAINFHKSAFPRQLLMSGKRSISLNLHTRKYFLPCLRNWRIQLIIVKLKYYNIDHFVNLNNSIL